MDQSIYSEEQENRVDILKYDPEKEKQKNSFIKNLEFMPPKLEKDIRKLTIKTRLRGRIC